MSVDAVTQRWEAFLGQIESRFDEIMRESIEGCLALFEQTGETLTLGNAWTGMRMRALALRTKINDVWDEKVCDAFDDAGADGAREDAERRKGEDLYEHMEAEAERVEDHIYCEIAKRLEAKAKDEQASVSCTQCGSPFAVPFVYMATNVSCPACSAINTVEPGTAARMIEGFSHHLSRQAAWKEFMAMRAAERHWRDSRNTTLAILQAWEGAQIDYWTAHLKHRASMFPNREKDLDADLRGKMHQFYASIQNEKAWVNGGRPRRVAPLTGG